MNAAMVSATDVMSATEPLPPGSCQLDQNLRSERYVESFCQQNPWNNNNWCIRDASRSHKVLGHTVLTLTPGPPVEPQEVRQQMLWEFPLPATLEQEDKTLCHGQMQEESIIRKLNTFAAYLMYFIWIHSGFICQTSGKITKKTCVFALPSGSAGRWFQQFRTFPFRHK